MKARYPVTIPGNLPVEGKDGRRTEMWIYEIKYERTDTMHMVHVLVSVFRFTDTDVREEAGRSGVEDTEYK